MKPARRLSIGAAGLFLAAVLLQLLGLPPWIWVCLAALIGCLMAFDLVWAVSRPAPAIERRLERVLSLGVPSRVELIVTNSRGQPCRLQIHDHHPRTFICEGLPVNVIVPPGRSLSLGYRVTPTVRGEHGFGRVAAWLTSPLGIWQRKIRAGDACAVRVYPNFQPLVRYTLLTIENRVNQLGIHKQRRRGKGLEFLQLRDYRYGDTPNQINWKATSRRLKLISCEYQDEQDQQVMLLLDCGRRMRTKDDALSHFDHTLNAVLLLAHIALRQGDSVGLMTFGGSDRHLAPRKGISAINRLLNATYDILPSVYASDLVQALEDCATRIRKRSLIVLVSNLIGQQPGNLVAVTHTLLQRHLVLYANLREAVLDRALEQGVEDLGSALRVAAVHEYLAGRADRLSRLRAEGIICLDVPPARLAPVLANAYFEIKAGRRL